MTTPEPESHHTTVLLEGIDVHLPCVKSQALPESQQQQQIHLPNSYQPLVMATPEPEAHHTTVLFEGIDVHLPCVKSQALPECSDSPIKSQFIHPNLWIQRLRDEYPNFNFTLDQYLQWWEEAVNDPKVIDGLDLKPWLRGPGKDVMDIVHAEKMVRREIDEVAAIIQNSEFIEKGKRKAQVVIEISDDEKEEDPEVVEDVPGVVKGLGKVVKRPVTPDFIRKTYGHFNQQLGLYKLPKPDRRSARERYKRIFSDLKLNNVADAKARKQAIREVFKGMQKKK